MDTSDGAGTVQADGGGIIFFLPGFSLLSISGAERRKDGDGGGGWGAGGKRRRRG